MIWPGFHLPWSSAVAQHWACCALQRPCSWKQTVCILRAQAEWVEVPCAQTNAFLKLSFILTSTCSKHSDAFGRWKGHKRSRVTPSYPSTSTRGDSWKFLALGRLAVWISCMAPWQNVHDAEGGNSMSSTLVGSKRYGEKNGDYGC